MVDNQKKLELYRSMLLIRRFEEKLTELCRIEGKLPGMIILCTGQEAVAAGVCGALAKEDVIISNHRSHGHLLAKGADPKEIMAEIYGKGTGCNRGKSGTLHLAVPEVNALCTTTVVGGGIPIAVGTAFAQQYQKSNHVTACFFGNGAADEGSFHESLNMAALWNLPVLFICENNVYSAPSARRAHQSERFGEPRSGLRHARVWWTATMPLLFMRPQRKPARCLAGKAPPLLNVRLTGGAATASWTNRFTSPKTRLPAGWSAARFRKSGRNCSGLVYLMKQGSKGLKLRSGKPLRPPFNLPRRAPGPPPRRRWRTFTPKKKGSGLMQTITMGQAVRQALAEEMRRDPNVFIAGEGIGVSIHESPVMPTYGLLKEFGPDRVKDTPVSEQAIAGLAVGASVMGLRPVVEIMFSPFFTLASDQIVNHAAKLRYLSGGKSSFPLVVRMKSGAGGGAGCQHSHNLEAWAAHSPGLKVVMPGTAADAKGLLKSAIRDDNPVVFIEDMGLYFFPSQVPEEDYTIPLGVADVKRRVGT